MIENNKWAYISFTTYTDDRGYEQIKEYTLYYDTKYVVNCSFTTILQHLPLSNICIFMKDLSLFYQINYNEISHQIKRDKPYFFYETYKPLYFHFRKYQFRDFNALELNNLEELKQLLENYDKISQVPKTLAGFVRDDLRLIQKSAWRYTNKKLSNNLFDKQLLTAYSGGDCDKVLGKLKGDMYSFDINSSYPTSLYYMKYPISNWVKVNGKHIRENDTKNPYIVNCTFTNIDYNSINCSIMKHWIIDSVNAEYNDKKLCSADKVTLTCTSLDFETIQKWYTYDNLEINHIYICPKWSYLPDLTRDKIKEYYWDKEDSKDPIKKRKLNIIYGVFCPHSNDIYELEDSTYQHKEDINVFPTTVGLFCSAYARKRLNDLLYDLRDTALYWDTDCIKGDASNMDKVYKIVEKHNKVMRTLYNKEDTWLLGQWKDEGIHDMIIIGKKYYIKDGVPTVAGATIPEEYNNCDENTVIPNAFKNVKPSNKGVKITYSACKFKNQSFKINNY